MTSSWYGKHRSVAKHGEAHTVYIIFGIDCIYLLYAFAQVSMSPGQGIADVLVGGLQMNYMYPLCVVMDFLYGKLTFYTYVYRPVGTLNSAGRQKQGWNIYLVVSGYKNSPGELVTVSFCLLNCLGPYGTVKTRTRGYKIHSNVFVRQTFSPIYLERHFIAHQQMRC